MTEAQAAEATTTTARGTVAIVGAHGKIGQLLARELTGRGYRVLGVHRGSDQVEAIEATGAVSVLHDLEADTAEHLAEALRAAAGGDARDSVGGEVEALVFTAGAGGGSGAARKMTVDLGGSTQSVAAARLAGISRFVQVSFIGVDRPSQPTDDESWDAYHRAKRDADAQLRETDLDWTVVRPGTLTDAPSSGRVSLGEDLGRRGDTSRGNVALLIAATLESPATVRRSLDVLDGADPIETAIANLGA